MPRVTFVDTDGSKREIDAAAGTSVMAVARSQGVPGIVAECGGSLTCASCHVFVDDDWVDRLPGVSDDEDDMLDEAAAGRTECSRLSCQIVLTDEFDGLVLHVPECQ